MTNFLTVYITGLRVGWHHHLDVRCCETATFGIKLITLRSCVLKALAARWYWAGFISLYTLKLLTRSQMVFPTQDYNVFIHKYNFEIVYIILGIHNRYTLIVLLVWYKLYNSDANLLSLILFTISYSWGANINFVEHT